MGSGSVTPGKVRGSGGLTVVGAVLVILGVTSGLVGESVQKEDVATWRLFVMAGGIMAAAGIVCAAALLVLLIAARSRRGTELADLSDAEDWGLDSAEEWLSPLRSGRRRSAAEQAGWVERPAPERPPRLAPVQQRQRQYPSDDGSGRDAGRVVAGARFPADPTVPGGADTRYPAPPRAQQPYQPAPPAPGPVVSPQRRGPSAPQRAHPHPVGSQRPPQPVRPGQPYRQPPNQPGASSPYPPGPLSERHAVGPGPCAGPRPENGSLPGARSGPERGPGSQAGPGGGLRPESAASPRSWFEASPRPPGLPAQPPDIRTGAQRQSRNGDPAGFAIAQQPAPMPAPPSRPAPPANSQASYPARPPSGYDVEPWRSQRPGSRPERPSPSEPSRPESAARPLALTGQDALDDTCPLPVILPGRPSGPAARQESWPERPPEPPRMPAPTPAPRTATEPARPATPAAGREEISAPSSGQRRVPAGQAPPDAETAARAARAKLDQLKDLYLTAEAIGEDALVRHFDEVRQRQRDLIREYFKQPGLRPSTILRHPDETPPQDGPTHEAESSTHSS